MTNLAIKKTCPYSKQQYCGYSQEVVDALRKERDELKAENFRLREKFGCLRPFEQALKREFRIERKIWLLCNKPLKENPDARD